MPGILSVFFTIAGKGLRRDQKSIFVSIRSTAESDHVEADIGWVAVPVGGTRAIGVVAPAAAADDAFGWGVGVGSRRPLPDIAGHVVEAEGRAATRVAADRRGAGVPVRL